eukprot:g12439.t1
MSNDNKNAGPSQPADAVSLEAQTNSMDCAKRLDLLIEKSFGELQFLLDEFSKLEGLLAWESKEALDGGAAEANPKMVKLRFFTSHVRRTMARMRDARSGRDPLSMPQLALLEEHIATSIAPVKERLVSQMERASGSGDSGSSLAALTLRTDSAAAARCRSGSISSGGSTRHEVSATDGEEGGHSTSRSSSVSSMSGGFGGESLSSQNGAGEVRAEARAGSGGLVGGGSGGQQEEGEEEEDEWSVGMELSGDVFGTGGSVCLGVVSSARAPTDTSPAAGSDHDGYYSSAFSRVTSASRSGSPFSRLCLDGGGGCGSGSGDQDVIGGSRTPLEHNRSRRDHLDMLSQLEAEGVFAADDSYSPCGRDPGMLGGVAFTPFMVSGSGKASPSRTTGACGEGGGDDLSPVPLRELKEEPDGGEDKGKGTEEEEETESGGGAPRKASAALLLPLKSVVKRKLSEKKPAFAGGVGGAVPGPTEAVEATPVGAGATVSPERAAIVAPGVVTLAPSGVEDGASPAAATSSVSTGVVGIPLIRPKCEPAATASARATVSPCSHAAAGEASGAKLVAAAAPIEAAEKGAPTTPVFSAGDASTMVAATRSVPQPGTSCAGAGATRAGATGGDTKMAAATAVTSAPSSKPLQSAGGGIRGEGSMLLVPLRPAKRRRASTLPSALLQPREVRYQCGLCSQSYASTVTGNPWWLLVRQECPACHKMQIPRVDILNPTNNVERHIAFLTESCAENGSDGDGSFMDWDGDTSDDNSGDESGDERDARGSSAGTFNGGDGGSSQRCARASSF